jgi:hypothetical protein
MNILEKLGLIMSIWFMISAWWCEEGGYAPLLFVILAFIGAVVFIIGGLAQKIP